MVVTVVASTMMSIEFLRPHSINQYTQTLKKAEHLTLENVRKDKNCIIVTADKGVAPVVMDKTE